MKSVMKMSANIIVGILMSSIEGFATVPAIPAIPYPEIYPFVPTPSIDIYSKVKDLSEDEQYVRNVFEMDSRGLARGRTHEQPWTSTYWPMQKGLIADTYRPHFNPFALAREFSWRRNSRRFERRMRRVLSNWRNLSENELEDLAPSEKYDLLLGDETFDLTHRLWDYVEKWGSGQNTSFVSALLPADGNPEDYVLNQHRSKMKSWEGICHGWATAAGHVPRPNHYVDVRLNNGKRLRFYPADIKGLASLLWANSIVQDSRWVDAETGQPGGGGVLMAGMRCNEKRPTRDEWGRTYDSDPDKYSERLESRCVGVHPAIWHMALVNLIGVQGRSFIVERRINLPVDNHPLAHYKFKYFDPYSGVYGSLADTVREVTDADQFRAFRNTESKKIVGIKLTMTYSNWERASREETDSPAQDSLKDIDMFYDLELDEQGVIVGGQWRTIEVGRGGLVRGERTQPNFFWVIAKDWQKYFTEVDLTPWTDTRVPPPADWKNAAINGAHAFVYNMTHEFGFDEKCEVTNQRTGEVSKIPCDLKFERAQPLVNVVNKLVEAARR